MPEYSFALYNAFSNTSFGGSSAGIIADAQDLDADQMQRIAKQIAAPATCFITGVDEHGVDVRFFSTQTEYLMCGHGTIALMTWLIERGFFQLDKAGSRAVNLRTPGGSASVNIRRREDSRPEVMLSLSASTFESCSLTAAELAPLFGVDETAFDTDLPFELTRSDFTHLIVPILDLASMQRVTPDFGAINSFCRDLQVDTVALFTRDTVLRESTIHCREFCPAVGTPEAPATGTTNRALACYLLRQNIIDAKADSRQTIIAEQGYEIDRPSRICTEMTVEGGRAVDIRVGGVATKSMEGTFCVTA
jgi:PhzF family phenazine biosynthesis protein